MVHEEPNNYQSKKESTRHFIEEDMLNFDWWTRASNYVTLTKIR
jgi:hypothetical protein